MQETQVRSLGWEAPTCHEATELLHHSYWACALKPRNCNHWAHMSQWPCSITREATATRSPQTPQLEENPCSNGDPAQPKTNKIIFNNSRQDIGFFHLGYGSKDGGCIGNWDFFGGKVKTCWWIMCGKVRSWCLLILGLVTGWLTAVFIGEDPRGRQFCEERVESKRFTVATVSFWCY